MDGILERVVVKSVPKMEIVRVKPDMFESQLNPAVGGFVDYLDGDSNRASRTV